MPVVDRRAIGRRAEDAVCAYLEERGCAIVARNVRLGPLEIDVLARRGPLAMIVEVRSRGAGSFAGPFASVTAMKRAALLRAAERLWRSKLRAMPDIERVRIDVAAVTFEDGSPRIAYHAGAIVG